MKQNVIEIALDWINEERKVALATVTEAWGSSPCPVGSQLVIDEKGLFEGSISGGCIEGAVITEALEVINTGKQRCLTFGMAEDEVWEVGLACGGKIEVYIERVNMYKEMLQKLISLQLQKHLVSLVTNLTNNEKTIVKIENNEINAELPLELKQAVINSYQSGFNNKFNYCDQTFFIHNFLTPLRLVIIGAVHIAQYLAKLAQLTGYEVTIIDPRQAFANPERFPNVRILTDWPDEALEKIGINSRTAIAILTHDPKLDDPALLTALNSGAFYIGALGSLKTHKSRLDRLIKAGFSKEALARIHGPVGLYIGAKTPAEISISIMAQITENLHLKK